MLKRTLGLSMSVLAILGSVACVKPKSSSSDVKDESDFVPGIRSGTYKLNNSTMAGTISIGAIAGAGPAMTLEVVKKGTPSGKALIKGTTLRLLDDGTIASYHKGECSISIIQKSEDSIDVKQAGKLEDCGFDKGVNVSGIYTVPKSNLTLRSGTYTIDTAGIVGQVVIGPIAGAGPTLSLSVVRKTGGNNMAVIEEAQLKLSADGTLATYKNDACEITLEQASEKTLKVLQRARTVDCGFGHGVIISGTYTAKP